MNRSLTSFAANTFVNASKLALALIAAALVVLAGCGGDEPTMSSEQLREIVECLRGHGWEPVEDSAGTELIVDGEYVYRFDQGKGQDEFFADDEACRAEILK